MVTYILLIQINHCDHIVPSLVIAQFVASGSDEAGVKGYTEQTISPPSIESVDSTAAGDSFMGGLLFHLARNNVTRGNLKEFCGGDDNLKQAVSFASRCGAYTASHKGAFSALPTFSQIKHFPCTSNNC